MTEPLAMLRLLQLASPALPIGAFNFSQGLELVIERQWIRTEADAIQWIAGVAAHGITTLDLPMLARMVEAFEAGDEATAHRLSGQLVAARETAELRAEERHLGQSLAKVLATLGFEQAHQWIRRPDCSYAALFALAAARSGIRPRNALLGYLWTWSENQVLCAVKLLPLGQSAGQRVLEALRIQMPGWVDTALQLEADAIGSGAPGIALASAWHESQYTRLFRS